MYLVLKVIVPVVSSNALVRLNPHNGSEPDYTLLEWVLAIACYDSAGGKGVVHSYCLLTMRCTPV
jgi:hypothetical protein